MNDHNFGKEKLMFDKDLFLVLYWTPQTHNRNFFRRTLSFPQNNNYI